MIKKDKQKEKAVALRRQGLSYNEILAKVSVVKSTLSLWLRDVGLSKQQQQKLTKIKLEAAKRGALARKNQRIISSDAIKQIAISEVPRLTKQDLWLAGVMLYWAEGSKQKSYNVSQGVVFANSDPNMLRLFMKWLKSAIDVPEDQVFFELYIHETGDKEKALKYWSKELNVSLNRFTGVCLKKNKINSKRRNMGENYYGLVRIKVKKSTDLSRRISGWIDGVVKRCPVV